MSWGLRHPSYFRHRPELAGPSGIYDSWASGANCDLERVEHPRDLQVRAGKRVAVQFGPRNPYSRTFLRTVTGVTRGTDVNVEGIAAMRERMRSGADQLRFCDRNARQTC